MSDDARGGATEAPATGVSRDPLDAPTLPSVTPDWPTANFQEREV